MQRLLLILVLAAGVGCTLLASFQPWYLLPDANANGFSPDASQEPLATRCFQYASLVVLALYAWSSRGATLAPREGDDDRIAHRRERVALASLWIAATLTFPYWTMIQEPRLAARAAWLQSLHEDLTWKGGDLSTSFEYRRSSEKQRVLLVDARRSLEVVPLPTWSITELGPSRFSDLLRWLGYSNAFCQFVRRGWPLACIGAVCLGIFACSSAGHVRFRRVGLAIRTSCCAICLFCVAAWALTFAAGRHLTKARDLTERGHYRDALSKLDAAIDWLPVMQHNTHLAAQRGLLGLLAGERDSLDAALYQAHLLEQEGCYEQAAQLTQRVLDASRAGSSQRREAARAVTRSAVNAFNTGALPSAVEQFQQVLQVEPAHLKALYGLQLAHLQLASRAPLEEAVQRQQEVYRYFQFANKKIVLAESNRHRLIASLQQNAPNTASVLLPKVRRP